MILVPPVDDDSTVDNGGMRTCHRQAVKGKSWFASAKNKQEFTLTSRWSSSDSRSLVSQAVQDDPDACDTAVDNGGEQQRALVGNKL
jgi:hypothetical protein